MVCEVRVAAALERVPLVVWFNRAVERTLRLEGALRAQEERESRQVFLRSEEVGR